MFTTDDERIIEKRQADIKKKCRLKRSIRHDDVNDLLTECELDLTQALDKDIGNYDNYVILNI